MAAGTDVERALAYHAATVHHLQRFARGPHGLDWDLQPDPFRRYAGAELVALEREPAAGGEPGYEATFRREPPAVALDAAALARLLWDSLAVSAWKRYGDATWALRVNPSSGNLHPTEAHVVAPAVAGLRERPFVAHYAPREHALEVRAELPADLWDRLAGGFPAGTFFVGLTSIAWREAWKYGERAFRYCQHDVGHAVGALSLAAAGLGWRARLVEEPGTAELAALLGVGGAPAGGAEPEEPDLLLALAPGELEVPSLEREAFRACAELPRRGEPNALSAAHVDWGLVDVAAEATRAPWGVPPEPAWKPRPAPAVDDVEWGTEAGPVPLRRLVHRRRSCLALDGRTGLAAEALFKVLGKTLAAPGRPPFDALPWRPRVDLVVFVHRVAGVDPGLYLLARDPGRAAVLRAALDPGFEWAAVAGAPAELPLFRLRVGDARAVAREASCHQEIAADGAFAVAMLAELGPTLRARGAAAYRELHWEAGAVGQVLYLEGEALGLGGTGIGCFFDDAVHARLGLTDGAFQDLYHFTVGGPVPDPRLTSLPAYPPPEREP